MTPNPDSPVTEHTIHLPAPTKWPILLAAGFVLTLAALITNLYIGVLGLALIGFGVVGWFRELFPREHHDNIVVREQFQPLPVAVSKVQRVQSDKSHRQQLPIKNYPIASGIKGGIAGGIAMILPAEAYGILRFHSIWYVINLLGGAGVAGWSNPTLAQIKHFNGSALLTASIIHVLTCLLVGLLYGAILPLWPSRPILLGGLLAPIAWTGLLYGSLDIINPFLAARIDWWSFAASQVFFGVVAGFVVWKSEDLKNMEQIPLRERLGIQERSGEVKEAE